jgi:hypothetical protein
MNGCIDVDRRSGVNNTVNYVRHHAVSHAFFPSKNCIKYFFSKKVINLLIFIDKPPYVYNKEDFSDLNIIFNI